MSVLDFQDLTDCANKERKAGYWHNGIVIHDGMPHPYISWVENTMTIGCNYDRKAIDPACAAAKCARIA